MSKKLCLKIEWLPHDVVEDILERAPVESLVRFKAVSKKWNSTIESRLFQNRQHKHRQQSGDPDVLMVSVLGCDEDGLSYESDSEAVEIEIESLRTLVLGSSSSVKIPTPWENTYHFVCQNSCDGLVCVYYPIRSGFVVNPATRWHRVLPLSNYQRLIIDIDDGSKHDFFCWLGFGKDIFTGKFKAVWLYNSEEIGLENATTCEVFDFSTNAWRYVTPSAPYRVRCHWPAYVDGSLYWLTSGEPKVLSFSLHTEAFLVISPLPFPDSCIRKSIIGNLNNRLYATASLNLPYQDIWLLNSGTKTWHKMYSINIAVSLIKLNIGVEHLLMPLALLDGKKKKKKKKKLLYHGQYPFQTLAIHDLETQSYDVAFTADSIGIPVCYFQSLISI